MADPVDIYGPDPSTLPELPAEWHGTQVAAPPIDMLGTPAEVVAAPTPEPEADPFLAAMGGPVRTGAFRLQDVDLANLDAPTAPAEAYPWLAKGPVPGPATGPVAVGAHDAFDEAMGRTGGGFEYETADNGIERPSVELVPEALDPMTAEQQADFMLNRGPEYVAAQEARINAEREQAVNAIRQPAVKSIAEQSQARTVAYNQQMAAAKAERAKLNQAGEQLKGDRWWSSRSTAQKGAAYIAAMIGGFLKPGGPNGAIDMFMHLVDQDIEMQKADRANKEHAVSQMFEVAGDELRAGETVRLTALSDLEEKLKTAYAGFDPAGTTALGIAKGIQHVQGEKAKAAAAQEATDYKRATEAAEFQLKLQAQAETARNNRSQNAVAWAGRNDAKARLGLDAAREGLIADGKGGWMRDPNAPVDPNAIKLQAEADKALSDAEKARRENDPAERERTLGVGGLKRKDGKPILFRNEAVAEKIGKAKAATDMAASLVDSLKVLRDDEGFSSNTIKSDRWRQMQADYASLQLEIKNTAELGVLAGPDMDIIGKALGTNDPTEFRDITAGLEAARKNLVNKLNYTIRSNDPQAERYEPERSEPAKAAARTKEESVAALTQPMPPHVRDNPESRAKYLEGRQEAVKQLLKRHDPSASEIRAWAKSIAPEIESLGLTQAETNAILIPLTDRLYQLESKK